MPLPGLPFDFLASEGGPSSDGGPSQSSAQVDSGAPTDLILLLQHIAAQQHVMLANLDAFADMLCRFSSDAELVHGLSAGFPRT